MQYNIVRNDDQVAVTVFTPGSAPLVAATGHPNLDTILEGIIKGDESVIALFDVSVAAAKKFERLSDRVTVAHGRLYLDGEEVNNALATQVVRFLSDGIDDWKPLVAFFENVQSNPNEHSREQLYRWLATEDFTITDDGMIIGYKSVNTDLDNGFTSIKTGTATVNGEVQNGKIKQKQGDIVEMPRGEVTHDPTIGCHVGLHVGTYGYAKSFTGDTMLEVRVHPRDVVSVPTESNDQKMRVCRYTVVDTIEKPYTEPIHYDNYFDYSDEDYCDECGELSEQSPCDECEYELQRGYLPDENEVDDLDNDPQVIGFEGNDTVAVGDVFETTDKRRAGTQFKVESIEGDQAVGKSLPSNLTRKVALDRLTSYRYKKVS